MKTILLETEKSASRKRIQWKTSVNTFVFFLFLTGQIFPQGILTAFAVEPVLNQPLISQTPTTDPSTSPANSSTATSSQVQTSNQFLAASPLSPAGASVLPEINPSGTDLSKVNVNPALGTVKSSGMQLAGVGSGRSFLVGNTIIGDAAKGGGAGASFDNFGRESGTIETGTLPQTFTIGIFSTASKIKFEAVSIDLATGIETKGAVILNTTPFTFNTFSLSRDVFQAQGVDTDHVRTLYAINPNDQMAYTQLYLLPQTTPDIQIENSDYTIHTLDGARTAVAIVPKNAGLGRAQIVDFSNKFYELWPAPIKIAKLRLLATARGSLLEVTLEGSQHSYVSIAASADPSKPLGVLTQRGVLTPDEQRLVSYCYSFMPTCQVMNIEDQMIVENLKTGQIQLYRIEAGQKLFPDGTPNFPAALRTVVNNNYAIVSTNTATFQLPRTGPNRITIVSLTDGSIKNIMISASAGDDLTALSFQSGYFIDATHAQINFYTGKSYLIDTVAGTATLFQPSINGSAYDPSLLTVLPGSPVVGSGKHDDNNNAFLALTQNSNHGFSFNYHLPNASDFAFAWMSFPSVQNLGTNPTLALRGPAGKQLKVEFKDRNGKVAVFYLNLTGLKQNYTFSFNNIAIPLGFNASQIKEIVFVVDQNKPAPSGTIAVETKGLNYTPTVNGYFYNPSVLPTLPGSPTLFTGKGDAHSDNNSVITQTQISPSKFSFDYQLPDPWDFAFSGVSFSTPQSLGLGPVFVLNGPAGKQLKVEIKDVNGNVATFYVNLTGIKQNYFFSLSTDIVPVGFKSNQIKEIVFVAEKTRSGGSGTIQVETNGLYCPFISPAENAAWAPLPGTPQLASVAAAPASAFMTAINSTAAQLTYNTSIVGWAGGGYTFDDYATSQVETADLSKLSNLVFALKGDVSQVKFEIIDDQNRKATVYLGDIRPEIDQMWSIPKSQLQGVDLTKVKTFYFIVEGQNKPGNLEIAFQKDPSIVIQQRDANGNITSAEVRYPDGRVYKITATNNALNILRVNPSSWRGGYYDQNQMTLSNVNLQNLKLINVQSDGLDLLLETTKIQTNGTRVKEFAIVFLPKLHNMASQTLVSAPSNPNFVFFDNPSRTMQALKNSLYRSGGELSLIDLRTGKTQLLARNSDQPLGATYTTQVYDVSADGSYVLYEVGYKDYVQGNRYWMVLQSIGNPNKKIIISNSVYAGPVQLIRFFSIGGNETIVQIKDKNGIKKKLKVNLITGAITVL